jgi:phosphatidylserine/phosphatidylglycerophosphate/cardiolipin synthase-like enzyme
MNLSDQLLEFFLRLKNEGLVDELFHDDIVKEMLRNHPEYHELNEQLSDAIQGDGETFILLALRTLAKQQAELQPQLVKTNLVVTFPGAAKIPARHTAQVVREMIGRARSEIIVAGYAITNMGGLPALLSGTASSVQRIIVLCSTWKSDDGISGLTSILKGWPKNRIPPVVYEFKGGDDAGLMHVKTLIVDGSDMLITSANFTEAGMTKNVEFGIQVNGRVVGEAKAIFDEFIRSGRFDRKV